MINRRAFLTGLIAAPAVVKFASLMPVRGIIMDVEGPDWLLLREGKIGTWTAYTDIPAKFCFVTPYAELSGDGSLERPFKTIREAVEKWPKRSSILLAEGCEYTNE